MAAIIQLYAPIKCVVMEDGNVEERPGDTRTLYPDAPEQVLLYECCFPEAVRELASRIPCDTVKDSPKLDSVIWQSHIENAALLEPYIDAALLYMRKNRDLLVQDDHYGMRGNYDTLLYELYRLCWEVCIHINAKVGWK